MYWLTTHILSPYSQANNASAQQAPWLLFVRAALTPTYRLCQALPADPEVRGIHVDIWKFIRDASPPSKSHQDFIQIHYIFSNWRSPYWPLLPTISGLTLRSIGITTFREVRWGGDRGQPPWKNPLGMENESTVFPWLILNLDPGMSSCLPWFCLNTFCRGV